MPFPQIDPVEGICTRPGVVGTGNDPFAVHALLLVHVPALSVAAQTRASLKSSQNGALYGAACALLEYGK